ncbi:unnamed protein product, partial [Amoebophrya sp. A25]
RVQGGIRVASIFGNVKSYVHQKQSQSYGAWQGAASHFVEIKTNPTDTGTDLGCAWDIEMNWYCLDWYL